MKFLGLKPRRRRSRWRLTGLSLQQKKDQKGPPGHADFFQALFYLLLL